MFRVELGGFEWEAFPSPNRYRKWYREIEKIENKDIEYREHNKKLLAKCLDIYDKSPEKCDQKYFEKEYIAKCKNISNFEKHMLSQNYYDEQLNIVNMQLATDYPQYIKVALELGIFVNMHFESSFNPNELIVVGVNK